MNYRLLTNWGAWVGSAVAAGAASSTLFAGDEALINTAAGMTTSLVVFMLGLGGKLIRQWVTNTAYEWVLTVGAECIEFVEEITGPGSGPEKKEKAIERLIDMYRATNIDVPWIPDIWVEYGIRQAADVAIDKLVDYMNASGLLPKPA